MEITTGRQRPGEAEESYLIRSQAFQHQRRAFDPEAPNVDGDRIHVARSGDRLVATVVTVAERQWFGGRDVPMAGVSGVAVLPEARGRGLARRLMTEAVEAMHERGEVISSLYPTTSALYRSVGYEFAGRLEPTRVELTELAAAARPPAERDRFQVEPLGTDLEPMRPLYDALAARGNGWLGRADLYWRRLEHFGHPDRHNRFGYVIREDGRAVAALHTSHTAGSHRIKFDVEVDGPFSLTPEAFGASMDLLRGLGTTVDRVSFSLPAETLALHLPGALLDHHDSWLWMLRLVDVAGALEARGYNPAVEARFALDVADPVAPWNEGRHQVEVAGGRASVERNGSTAHDRAVSLDVQSLAALYTGFADPYDLAAAGRLAGGDRATLDDLAAAFSGPPPRLLDHF